MKRRKRICLKAFSMVLTVAMVLSSVPLNGLAEGIFKDSVFGYTAKATVLFDEQNIEESGFCGDNIRYEIDKNRTLRVSGTGEMTSSSWSRDILNAIITDGIENIPERAFFGCNELEAVVLGEDICEIGDSAFENCWSLISINFPDSLEKIGMYAFLQSRFSGVINLPASVTDIGTGAFLFCAPKAFSVDENNKEFSSKDGVLYNKKQTVLLYYPAGSTENSFTVPSSVTMIDASAFQYSYNLKEVKMSDSVNILGSGAFLNCMGLQSVELSDKLLCISDVAFSGCSSLKNIDIPEGVTKIDEWAFFHCPALESVSLPSSLLTVGTYVFGDCEALERVNYRGTQEMWEEVSVESGNEALEASEFSFLSIDTLHSGACGEKAQWKLNSDGTLIISGSGDMEDFSFEDTPWYEWREEVTGIIIEDGITRIGSYSFMDCENMTFVQIPDSVKTIGGYSFFGCYLLRRIDIPEGVEQIEYFALFGCISLSSVTIPASVTLIEETAFSACQDLHTINVDSKNTCYQSVDGNLYDKEMKTILFYSIAKEDASFTIPDGVERIGDFTFSISLYLESVIIPDSVTEIGFGAFQNADKIRNIFIPASVTEIGAYSFAGCTSLTTVTFEKGSCIEAIESGAFSTVPSLSTVYFGGTSEKWNEIEIDIDNESLLEADIIFEGEQECLHLWDEGTVTLQPTESRKGERTYTCTKCGLRYTEEIEKLQKKWSKNTQYSFPNASSDFVTGTYTMLDSDFDILCDYVKQYYDPYSAQQVINVLNEMKNSEWCGSCHGMALTSLLDYYDKIDMQNCDPYADTLYETDSPKDNEKVQSVINYYFLTQVLGFLNENYYAYYGKGNPNWAEGLISLVRHTQENELVLFGYWFYAGGHSIVIKGYEGKDKNGNHVLTAYDNRFPEQDVQVVVSGDYSSCTICTPYGKEDAFAIDMYLSLDDFDMVDIDGPDNDGKLSFRSDTRKDNASELSVVVSGDMTIRNKENEYISIKDGIVDSTMNILDTRMVVSSTADGGPGPVRLIFTVSDSEYFTFTSEGDELSATVRTGDSYSAINAVDAYAATISDKNGVSVSGPDAEYTIHRSCDDMYESGFDMMCFKGTSTGSTLVNYEDGYAFVSGSKAGSLTVGKYTDNDYEENTFNTKTDSATVKMAGSSVAGDIDNDGKVTANDARTALRASVGLDVLSPRQHITADADKNGNVTAYDARAILRCSVGLEEL